MILTIKGTRKDFYQAQDLAIWPELHYHVFVVYHVDAVICMQNSADLNFTMIQFHRFRSPIMLTSWLTHRFCQTWEKLVIILETSNKSLHTCLWIDTFYGFKL